MKIILTENQSVRLIKLMENESMKDYLNDLHKLIQNNKKLYKGMNNYSYDSGVATIQSGLDRLGYNFGSFGIDGKFGNETEKNVKKFQEDEDLEVTGEMKTEDIKKLKSILEKSKKVDDVIEPQKEEEPETNNNVILVGGLDYRGGDLKISQQEDKVQNNLVGKKVKGFRYNNPTGAIEAIKENPNAYVILFSAGCNYSSQIANVMKDKKKLFIVEPYGSSSKVVNTVNNAVNSGVPKSNVITGPYKARGAGIVPGSTQTPSDYSHWGALEFVTKFIK